MKNSLIQLIEKYKKGKRSTFNLGPFLSINLIKDEWLPFNAILQNPEDMAAAAMLNFKLGFDTTVLPFDLNVEALNSDQPRLRVFHIEAILFRNKLPQR